MRILILSLILLFAGAAQGLDDRSGESPQPSPRTRLVTDPFSFQLVWIPTGRFRMGDTSGRGQADEQPVREVTMQGFWMMRTEVTRAMFARFVEATGHDTGQGCWVHEGDWVVNEALDWRSPGFPQTDNHPVTCVSWHDAQAFINWLNQQTGRTFRLPTEAEWEYATRAGSDTVYYWGDSPALLCSHANAADRSALQDYPGFAVNDCDDGHVRTSPAASFASNPWGLHDLYGNVWEWVEDCWHPSYKGAPRDGSAVRTGECDRRGFRGGGYGDIPHFARSTLRNRGDSTHRKDDIGFRLVVSEPEASNGGSVE
jgi:formylglycine-generating enzyme required for sulfatase activity